MKELNAKAKELRRKYTREYMRAYYKNNPEQDEKRKKRNKEYMKKYRAAHPEKFKQYTATYWNKKAAELEASASESET